MPPKTQVDVGTPEMLIAPSKTSALSRLSSGPLARHYCLVLSTALLSAAAFCCVLASGLSCSFLSVSVNNPDAVIDYLNATNNNNVSLEDQWYYDELMSEENNGLSVGILCQGDLDWLAPSTSDNSMRLLSKVFLIVALVLGGLLLIVTCGISTFVPTSDLIWDGISYVAAGLFVCEMPIFFLLDSPPCNNYKGMFSCQLGSGSYSLIVSMVCSLSLAILTQWKNAPDWKEEYEIWDLRRRNEQMKNLQPGLAKTHEENSKDHEDEEMGRSNQHLNQQQQSLHSNEPEEIGVEIQVEKVPSPPRQARAVDQEEHHFTGQVIDFRPRNSKQYSPSRSLGPSVSTEVYGSDHGRNVMKEPITPECQYRANGIRPVSPLSNCTGLSSSPGGAMSPATSPNDYGHSAANNISNITDKATFMEHETLLAEEPENFAASYLVKTPKKVTYMDDASVSKQSVTSKQSIVSMMRDKLWKSSNDVEFQSSILDDDREEVQESWMVEDVSVGNSGEVMFDDNRTSQSVEPQARHNTDTQPEQAPPSPTPVETESDIERDIAGLIVPGMISQMKEQIAKKPVVSPERLRDPEIDMYPSESSVSELSLPNVEDEEYLKRIEQDLRRQKSKPAEPILNLPSYQSDSSGGESELDQVIAGVQRINRKISGKITPLNRRARRRKIGGGSISGDSYSSAQGSLLDEVIIEEGENLSTEISLGSGGIPKVITPDNKTSRTIASRVHSFDDDDGYRNEQSAEEDDDEQSVTSSVASARRYRLALNRKAKTETDSIASTGNDEIKSKSATLEEFLDSEAGVSNEEKVKLLQEALSRLQAKQKVPTGDEGYLSTAKSEKSQQSLTRVNQRYGPKAETVDLPLNSRITPHAQDVNTGAAPTSTSDKNHTDSAWQARKARLKRLRMLRAEEENESADDIIRANGGSVVCASDEGSI